ncbi:hypothetical protein YTPLAS18_13250 [Nitrospira sp.]|nr:hypothetical protein YTPLAS18_13250 [Nitrospira sp.]
MLPVAVATGAESGIIRVSYFWYAQDHEPLPYSQGTPALIADAHARPPFGGLVQVPPEGLGLMRLLAVAEVAQGRMGTILEFDERELTVAPAADLKVIEFPVEKPWQLGPIGALVSVPLVGEFSDGLVRSLEGTHTGTSIHSGDPDVVEVLDAGRVRAVGAGRATLTVENRGRRAQLDVVVSGGEKSNGAPRADPGPAQRVTSGRRVRLNGVGSVDPDGDPLRYEWTQVRGLKVDMIGPNESTALFVAPFVSATRLLRFRLRVTDMAGPDVVKGADSLPAFVDIWVEP